MKGYRRLNDALNTYSEGKLFLAKDVAIGGIKMYYMFDSVEQFFANKSAREHYHEVLHLPKMRIYFDIDIPTISYNEDPTLFIEKFKEYLNVMMNKPTMKVYSSHSSMKYSYHIILQDRYAYGPIECKKKVMEIKNSFIKDYPNERLGHMIDIAVYGQNRLFRVLGSSKIEDPTRAKVEYPVKVYKDKAEEMQAFKDSLICHYL